MFAIASQMSFVVFRSKTDLINHLKKFYMQMYYMIGS